VLLSSLALANAAFADVIQFNGIITQSTADGTGPAVNNPLLNAILDGDPFAVALTFPVSITAPSPAAHDLTGATLVFTDQSQPGTESSFGSISLTVSANGVFDTVSLLACLTTGSGCAVGNQLTASFQIPAAMLNSQNVAAAGLDQPHPLDLLEDDGTTDIHGSIDQYSYRGASAVPEPSQFAYVGCVVAAIGFIRKQNRRRNK